MATPTFVYLYYLDIYVSDYSYHLFFLSFGSLDYYFLLTKTNPFWQPFSTHIHCKIDSESLLTPMGVLSPCNVRLSYGTPSSLRPTNSQIVFQGHPPWTTSYRTLPSDVPGPVRLGVLSELKVHVTVRTGSRVLVTVRWFPEFIPSLLVKYQRPIKVTLISD